MAILARLRERPCVPRMVWMASYLCAVWERALAAYERALIQDAGDGGIERARAVVREVDDVMRSEPVAAGLGLFSRAYGDLMMRHARLSALAFVRALAGRGPLVVSDADTPTLMAAAQRAYRGVGTEGFEEATE